MKIKKKWKIISENKYKKIIKKLPHTEYIDFFKSCYLEEENNYKLIDSINKKDLKKLKLTYKIIRKNKGLFNLGKVVLVISIVAVSAFFSIFLKDKIITKVVTNNLEKIFDAKVDINNLSSSIIGGNFTISGLQVADKNSPMNNLFEISSAKVQLSIEQLFRGNIHIPIIESRGLQFNTDRVSSGALESVRQVEVIEQSKNDSTADNNNKNSLLGFDTLKDVDYQSILENEKEKLITLKKVDELKTNLDDKKRNWEDKIDLTKKEITQIGEDLNKVKDINSLSDPVEIKDYILNITSLKIEIEKQVDNISTMEDEYNSDLSFIKNAPNEVLSSIDIDKDFILSRVGLDGNSSASGAISNLLSEYGDDKINKIYGIILKSYNIWKKIEGYNKEQKVDVPRRNSTYFDFNGTEYPKLLIERISLSLGDKEQFSGSIENITSNNSIIDKPTTVNVSIPNFDIYGAFDNRKNKDVLVVGLKTNQPLDIPVNFSTFNIESISGRLISELNMNFKNITNSNATLSGNIIDLIITSSNSNAAINALLEEQKEMEINGTFGILDSKVRDLSIKSNLDDILIELTKDIATQLLLDEKSKASEQIDKYFEGVLADLGIGQYLDFVPSEIDSVDRVIEEYSSIIDKYSKDAEEKLTYITDELQSKADAIVAEAEAKAEAARKEAEAKAEDKLNDLKQSIPKFGF